MYRTNRFVYIDRKEKLKFEVFARHVEFANGLIERVNKACRYNLKQKRFGFARRVLVEIPPYELEMLQQDYVERMEAKANEPKN